AGSGSAGGAAGAGSGSAAGAAGAGSGSAGGAGGGAPQLLYCSGELGRWQLTDEQKGAYCRNGGPDGDRCELTLQAVIAPPPGARPDGLLGPLACEWGASVSNYDFYQLDDPTVDIVP
ncbi:MAG TPA: hypothetical protein VFS00_29875, partial [Polyangiaceae bacterium]|nr:hypothetical protein [Polyangiaceae bacterium]